MDRLKILCSGILVRLPVGGLVWHHLQYLIGLHRLGHDVSYFESFGWRKSCYDVAADRMTSHPAYGISRLQEELERHGITAPWCYLSENGDALGMTRAALMQACRECDLYINLSNLNWIPELEACRRRVLIDTDPVLTQIGAFGDVGRGGPLSSYDRLFTYGANVHRAGCSMPDAGARWLPTRQPVVLDLWTAGAGDPTAPFTTVTNWSAVPVYRNGQPFGNKDRQFEPFFTLPRDTGQPMAIAVGGDYDREAVLGRFRDGGWLVGDAWNVSQNSESYQQFIAASRAEFSVAKHAYVATRCGWFGDRSAAYLASGRPAVLQDTGFSDWLPTGAGVLPFTTREEAIAGLHEVNARYRFHCRAAKDLAAAYFDARTVLTTMLDQTQETRDVHESG